MVELTRTFYPVGFGAFYTEKHELLNGSNNKAITIVYDCGTKTSSVNIKDQIKDQFPNPGMTIDILFISHFDDDHISGIPFLKKYCKIRKIVIPYIPPEDKILFIYVQFYRLYKYFFLNKKNRSLVNLFEEYKQLILDPDRYFGGDIEVVTVYPEGSELNEKNKISFSISNSKWKYIPFNYNYAKKVIELKKKLSARPYFLSYNRLSDDKYIKNNYNKIVQVYKSIKAPNSTSLVLLSGLVEGNGHACVQSKPPLFLRTPNCIYLGDVSAKSGVFKKCLNKHLKEYKDAFSTIQIPHHGSKWNFDVKIVPQDSVSVISHKSDDTKHPDPSVKAEIRKASSLPIDVTEENYTKFVECGSYC